MRDLFEYLEDLTDKQIIEHYELTRRRNDRKLLVTVVGRRDYLAYDIALANENITIDNLRDNVSDILQMRIKR